MSKPLTIEELKALGKGDWVRKINLEKPKSTPRYEIVTYNYEQCIVLHGYYHSYKDYGVKWIAYKNKEQAEGKDDKELLEIRYNALKQAIIEVCDKLNDKSYAREFYSITLGSKVQRIERIASLKELKGESV